MRTAALALLLLSFALGVQARAESVSFQPGNPEHQREIRAALSPTAPGDKADHPEMCPDGVSRDDGSLEEGYRIPFAADARYVQLLAPTSYPSTLQKVCVAFMTNYSFVSMPFNVVVYDDNGTTGGPGSFLGFKPGTAVSVIASLGQWTGVSCADLNVTVVSGGVYVGAQWNAASDYKFFIAADTTLLTSIAQMYQSSSAGNIWNTVQSVAPNARALAARAEFAPVVVVPDPPPPLVAPLLSSQYSNFRFWVRISDTRIGTPTDACLPETLCVAGAIPTRAEVFVRIVGPKPDGHLWPNVVKFNTTKTEVWIQQISTDRTKYYLLPALAQDSATLPGLVDKEGFIP